jgi:uncharacterized protein DUF5666
MRIPTWRLVLTGGAIVLLLGVGIGIVAASTSAGHDPAAAALAAPTAAPGTNPDHPRIGARLKALLGGSGHRLGGRLVHVTATVLDKDGNLVTLQLDHGTIQAIGSGTLTVSEAGGATVTVSTDASTLVRIGRDKGTLGDLKAGDQVFVQSRVSGNITLAKHILEVPATAGG